MCFLISFFTFYFIILAFKLFVFGFHRKKILWLKYFLSINIEILILLYKRGVSKVLLSLFSFLFFYERNKKFFTRQNENFFWEVFTVKASPHSQPIVLEELLFPNISNKLMGFKRKESSDDKMIIMKSMSLELKE